MGVQLSWIRPGIVVVEPLSTFTATALDTTERQLQTFLETGIAPAVGILLDVRTLASRLALPDWQACITFSIHLEAQVPCVVIEDQVAAMQVWRITRAAVDGRPPVFQPDIEAGIHYLEQMSGAAQPPSAKRAASDRLLQRMTADKARILGWRDAMDELYEDGEIAFETQQFVQLHALGDPYDRQLDWHYLLDQLYNFTDRLRREADSPIHPDDP
jgi:hypothetical protein